MSLEKRIEVEQLYMFGLLNKLGTFNKSHGPVQPCAPFSSFFQILVSWLLHVQKSSHRAGKGFWPGLVPNPCFLLLQEAWSMICRPSCLQQHGGQLDVKIPKSCEHEFEVMVSIGKRERANASNMTRWNHKLLPFWEDHSPETISTKR